MRTNTFRFLVTALLMMQATASWALIFDYNGINYQTTSENTVQVYNNVSYSGTTLDIPHTVKYENITYSVTSISMGAFSFCRYLKSVAIPSSVTSIEDRAFSQCENLTSIYLPNSITSIGESAFYDCENLTSINIPNSITIIKNNTFEKCFKLSSITIPNSVTTIGDYAFSYCRFLASITIPNSVTSIGEGAFSNCNFLTSVTCEGENPPITPGNVFLYNSTLSSIYVPFTSMSQYKSADGWSAYADKIIPTPLTEAAYQAGLNAALGNMGEPQNGPAIEVTKGTKSVKLYQPEKVEFIMVNEEQ